MKLYIIMRNDMDSLNPGKACAQAAHAANEAVDYLRHNIDVMSNNIKPFYEDILNKWTDNGDRAFGTTIVLSGSIQDIYEIHTRLHDGGYNCGEVHDPSYPIKDGEVTHLVPLDTCMWFWAEEYPDWMKERYPQVGLMA